jgi:hypothetical protein
VAEYIERKAAIKAIYESDPNGIRRTLGFNVGQIEEALRAIPAADVAPVQHGQWIAEGEEQNDRRKSMGRLISADALIKNHFSDEHNIALSYANKIWMRQIINAEPTVDAVPRELFDKLLKDMCEMCFMWGDGLCPFCKWKEYRTDANEPDGA